MGVGLSREVPFKKDFKEQAWQSWGTEEKLEQNYGTAFPSLISPMMKFERPACLCYKCILTQPL